MQAQEAIEQQVDAHEGQQAQPDAAEHRLLGSIPGLARSLGEGKGHLLQYSGLENSIDCIVHGVAKSRTLLSLSLPSEPAEKPPNDSMT